MDRMLHRAVAVVFWMLSGSVIGKSVTYGDAILFGFGCFFYLGGLAMWRLSRRARSLVS